MNHIEWTNRYLCKQWVNTDDMLNTIIDAIKNDKPLSYTRYGDGELVLLKEYFNLIKEKPDHITLCDADLLIDPVSWIDEPYNVLSFYSKKLHRNTVYDNYMINRWGLTDSAKFKAIIKTIGENLLCGLQQSSHIGIYDQTSMVLNSTIDDFYLYKHSYVPHIQLFVDCGVDFKKLTDVNVNRNKILENPFEFKKILNGKPIHIFTSNEEELKNITKLHEILETSITYTNISPTKRDWTTHSFAHHDYIKEKSKDIKEHIVLYGLGYGAKHIPGYLHNTYGKAVIDIGSVLDVWAGRLTRPHFKDKSYALPSDANQVESFPWDTHKSNY